MVGSGRQVVETLVALGEQAGAQDAFEFAEWLVVDQDHFGPSDTMTPDEVSAWMEEAMSWWYREKGVRR